MRNFILTILFAVLCSAGLVAFAADEKPGTDAELEAAKIIVEAKNAAEAAS